MTERSTRTGILLFAHGSSVDDANRGVHELANQLAARGPYSYVRAAFLERARPDLGEAVAQAVAAGIRRVIVIPYFLTLGLHLQRDLPHLIASLRHKYPDVVIDVGQSLEGHPLMSAIILGRVQEVMAGDKTTQ